MKSSLFENSREYLEFLQQWQQELPSISRDQVFTNPEGTAILSVDVIKGFCTTGPLASPRVARIIQPIVKLMRVGWEKGLRKILLIQDTHEADAVEFGSFPPHCVRGSEEAQTVDEIRSLPFYDQLILLPKNSIASGSNASLHEWIAAHSEVLSFIVVGDCTDLCTYQLAMFLKTDANEKQQPRKVIVPADCVDTYDLPVDAAKKIGAVPHPAELLHVVFLHHMALNGVEIVGSIA